MAAGEQVRGGEALLAQHRAVGAAADRLADGLDALRADRPLGDVDDLRERVDEAAHVRVLRPLGHRDARARLLGGDPLGGAPDQGDVLGEQRVVEVARDEADLRAPGVARELERVDEALAVAASSRA